MSLNVHLGGAVGAIDRYPVKSMRGEPAERIEISERGIAGDRLWAVLDEATGKIASAKAPRLWRGLLMCAAHLAADGETVEITLPDGMTARAGEPSLDRRLSDLLGRAVRLIRIPPEAASLERSHPEAVLAEGLDAEVGADVLEIAAASPAATFFDYAPLHVITTATLDSLSKSLADGPIERPRYRANVVIQSPDDSIDFPENGWVGFTLRIGDTVSCKVVLSTPRCAIPTLAQGVLPSRPTVLRTIAARNMVDIPGFGVQPCAGVYATVTSGGAIRAGDRVIVSTDGA
jgi:uncharacterized protein YcbX